MQYTKSNLATVNETDNTRKAEIARRISIKRPSVIMERVVSQTNDRDQAARESETDHGWRHPERIPPTKYSPKFHDN